MNPDQTEQPAEGGSAREPSRRTAVISALVGAVLVAWFFFAWLWQGQDVVDAAGESVGSALVILLVVSVGGAIGKNRQP
jgi:H+/gluconate symporter-like permease